MILSDEKAEMTRQLRAAIQAGNLADVEMALDNGADAEALGAMDRTMLYYAASCSNASIILRLLKENVDPNGCDEDGMTPLHSAIASKCFGNARLLLENGANIDFKFEDKVAVIHMAFLMDLKDGSTDRLAFVLKNGADTSIGLDRGGAGKTVFDMAQKHAFKDDAAKTLLQLLIDHAEKASAPVIETPVILAANLENAAALQSIAVATRGKFRLKA